MDSFFQDTHSPVDDEKNLYFFQEKLILAM